MTRRIPGGFTMIELIIVVMIVGLVLAVAVPSYQRYIERSRVMETVIAVGDMSKGIRRYEMSKGALPDSLMEAGYGTAVDAWGFGYQYLNLRTAKGGGVARQDKKLKPLNSDFDLYSVGRDGLTAASLGKSVSRDDIIRARDGGFIGTAEEFDP